MNPVKKVGGLLQAARKAQSETKVSLPKQLLEYARLRRCKGKIGPAEYFEFKLYNPETPFGKKTKYVGWAGEQYINNYFNNRYWSAVTLDKIFFYTIMQGANLPFPAVKAIYCPDRSRAFPGAQVITDAETLERWLADELAGDKLFVKPSLGNYGRNSFLLTDWNARSRQITSSSGVLSSSDFADTLDSKPSNGYIFQQYIQPHENIAEFTDNKASTIRISLVFSKNAYYPLHATWKLPVGDNHIDNFHRGTTGNLAASINVESGLVETLVGPDGQGDLKSLTHNPQNGCRITGLVFPMWAEIIEACEAAGQVMPGLQLLHFDVALSRKGPLLVEVNRGGNVSIHQQASGRGFLSDELAACMDG